MLHYPMCVRKVQEELDAVVGEDRMPNFEDQQSLPYLDGFIKETLKFAVFIRIRCGQVVAKIYSTDGEPSLLPESHTHRPKTIHIGG